MKLVYLAGPYRGKSKFKPLNWLQRQINIYKAARVARELWKMGFAVICPHMNSKNFDGICPEENFLDGDVEILSRCDFVVVLPDWSSSLGTTNEIMEAKAEEIPYYFWSCEKDKIKEN